MIDEGRGVAWDLQSDDRPMAAYPSALLLGMVDDHLEERMEDAVTLEFVLIELDEFTAGRGLSEFHAADV
jgi:hypothetical protein